MGQSEYIDRCRKCHEICLQAVAYCFSKGVEESVAEVIWLLLECAQICETAAGIMQRQSDVDIETREECAEICQACAEACEQVADNEVLQACAEACRRCVESCRAMAVVAWRT